MSCLVGDLCALALVGRVSAPRPSSRTCNNQPLNLAIPGEQDGKSHAGEVTVVDIKMPFLSIVVFMVKASIAAIPAVIILTLVGSLVMSILGATFGVTIHHV
jgi:predicted transcriptional regulator